MQQEQRVPIVLLSSGRKKESWLLQADHLSLHFYLARRKGYERISQHQHRCHEFYCCYYHHCRCHLHHHHHLMTLDNVWGELCFEVSAHWVCVISTDTKGVLVSFCATFLRLAKILSRCHLMNRPNVGTAKCVGHIPFLGAKDILMAMSWEKRSLVQGFIDAKECSSTFVCMPVQIH